MASELTIASGSANQQYPDVAGDASSKGYTVVWQHGSSNGDIHGCRVMTSIKDLSPGGDASFGTVLEVNGGNTMMRRGLCVLELLIFLVLSLAGSARAQKPLIWQIETVDGEGDVGKFMSLVLVSGHVF